jgi:hypothetical protein
MAPPEMRENKFENYESDIKIYILRLCSRSKYNPPPKPVDVELKVVDKFSNSLF